MRRKIERVGKIFALIQATLLLTLVCLIVLPVAALAFHLFGKQSRKLTTQQTWEVWQHRADALEDLRQQF